MSNHRHTNTSYLRVHVVCLPIVAISISSIKCLSVFAKTLPLEQKQTAGQMFLMRENMAREAGVIQLLSRKVNVLYAYIIQGECELTTSAGRRRLAVLSRTPCFHYSFKIPASSHVQNARFARLLFSSRQPPVLCSPAAAGVFSVHGAGWWAENTAGAGHCNVLQCSLLCYAHPLSSILALPLTISHSLSPYLSPSLVHTRIICLAFLSPLSSHCFCHLVHFLHTLKADRNPVSYIRYLNYSALYHSHAR